MNTLTGMGEDPFSWWSSPQAMPLAIARLMVNDMEMDILSPPKTPLIITLGELPAPPTTSPNQASQSLTPPLPIPLPMLPVPPHAMGLSTSPSQRLLALVDVIQNANTSPLPLDNHTPNPPPLSTPATPNPSLSCPLTPVVFRCQSPLPSFFHNHTPSPPSESHILTIGMGVLIEANIKDVRKKCQALLKAMEAHEKLRGALEAWTEDLMLAINILGNDGLNDKTFFTTFHNFATVQHLFLVPQILDKIKSFIQDNSIQSDKPVHPATCYNPTISLSTSPSSSPVQTTPPLSTELEDPTHPGVGWALFDTSNTGHYPLIFLNKQDQPEVAKYICFRTVDKETHLVGTQGKGEAKYATPLYAKAYPSPNFNHCGVKDTDLNIFHPAHTSCLLVDTALVSLRDPGVLANVHRFRAYHNSLTSVKRQCLELDKQENWAEAKLHTVEWHLTSSAIWTHLQQHLLATCPPSPPTATLLPTHDQCIPCIFAAQGLPDIKPGEDNLEGHTVLGKRCHGVKPKFPYCLRCSTDKPRHMVEECPLWKTCQWCLSTQHAHNKCPSPHNSCESNCCLIYFRHPNFGSYCSTTPAGLLCHELEMAYQSAKWDNTDTCYEGSDM